MAHDDRRYGNYDSRANRIAGGILIIIVSLLCFLSLVNALGGVGRVFRILDRGHFYRRNGYFRKARYASAQQNSEISFAVLHRAACAARMVFKGLFPYHVVVRCVSQSALQRGICGRSSLRYRRMAFHESPDTRVFDCRAYSVVCGFKHFYGISRACESFALPHEINQNQSE